MEWYQIISYTLTNELRLLFGLYFIIKLFKLTLDKKAVIFAFCGGLLVSILMIIRLSSVFYIATEIIILIAITRYLSHKNIRMCIFFSFFYEI